MTTTALRTVLAATGFLIVAGFFLTTEHRAHVFGLLPFLLILACPLLHVMLHRGRGSEHSHGGGRHDGGPSDRSPAAPFEHTVADQSVADQSVVDVRRRHDSPDHYSREVRAEFGAEYDDDAARTPAFLPRSGRLARPVSPAPRNTAR